jgi:hypothetical protein
MAKPLTLPLLSNTQVTELRQLYDSTTNANLRLRCVFHAKVVQGYFW